VGESVGEAVQGVVERGGELRRREIHQRLREELARAFPDAEGRMEYLVLEKLPYLTAVMKEGLITAVVRCAISFAEVVPKGRRDVQWALGAPRGEHLLEHLPAGCPVG
jgi:hypothetical protein